MAVEKIKQVPEGKILNEGPFVEFTQVHLDLAAALENVLKDRLHTDTYSDLADKLVLELNGKVALLPKSIYDKLPNIRELTSKP